MDPGQENGHGPITKPDDGKGGNQMANEAAIKAASDQLATWRVDATLMLENVARYGDCIEMAFKMDANIENANNAA
ncbi:hypothetical protein ACLKA7_013129 [Drosophila subpalustris]